MCFHRVVEWISCGPLFSSFLSFLRTWEEEEAFLLELRMMADDMDDSC